MSSSKGDAKVDESKKQEKPKKQEPIDVIDSTPFPVPELYFKVFESEADEPDAKIRRDVNKLYEKWLADHGRRWPDRGMNTEDLVWLQEEAYKTDHKQSGSPAQLSAKDLGMVPIEKEEYEGEFISEPGEEDEPGKAKKSKRPNMSNYEASKAGGLWVTDEFESDDYIAGNLELMWDMYLWDRDGKPTIMPEEPADPAAGEESEAWEDFHTAYRPRGISSDEAREAVWVTDEFESDEDNTESEWEPEYVGAGLGLDAEDPINPQYSLRHSNHPLAPFPGEPLKWASYAYDDGTTYEGLTRDAVPHGMGVMAFGNGTGGGFHFRDVRRGDKFEGEFQAGYAHGLGMMTSEMRGEVYIGEFFAGQKHGCGLKIDMKPYYYLLERGDDPVSAYRKTYDQIMRNIEFRTWYRNRALGSDYEDEVVLEAFNEDMENPYDLVLRNGHHEQKLRDWKGMDPEEKAMSKMVEIIEQVGSERMARRAAYGFQGSGYYRRDRKGKLVEDLDSQGNDTEYDSMDLMLGNTTDGGMGPGWVEDTQDASEYSYDPAVAEEMAVDVAKGKREEQQDKERILGDRMLNPITGLSVKDYLEGKEGKHKELLGKWSAEQLAAMGDKKQKQRGVGTGAVGSGLVPGVRNLFGGDEGTTYQESDDVEVLQQVETSLSKKQQDMLLNDMVRYDAAYGSSVRPRRAYDEGTDTRFETESDMMELCDLAEILGTVDEAQEIVNRARMWRWKPYGEATIRYAQDGQGVPVDLMQDPLHYPHGTKFMAPGPVGQCHPIPDDRSIRTEMLRVAQNYQQLYEMYNFDYDPEPGSIQYKIDQRIRRAQELSMSQLARMEEAVDEELAASSGQQAQALTLASVPSELSSGSSRTGPATGSRGFGGSGSMFASMSMSFGMGRASRALMDMFSHAAKHAQRKPAAPRRQATQGRAVRKTRQPQ